MSEIRIPPAALEAAWCALSSSNATISEVAAACLAMIEAWPGSYSLAENDSAEIREVACIILPLTEKTDG